MHACTCRNRQEAAQWFGPEAILTEVICDYFDHCYDEERSSARSRPMPLAAVLAPQSVRVSFASVMTSIAALAVVAALGAAGWTQWREAGAVRDTALPALEGAIAMTAASAPTPHAIPPSRPPSSPAMIAFRQDDAAPPKDLELAPTTIRLRPEGRPSVTGHPRAERGKERLTKRSENRRSHPRARKDPDADVDRNRLPADSSYDLHERLAKVSPAARAGAAPAALPSAASEPALSPAVTATPRRESVESLLREATGRASAPSATADLRPQRLDDLQIRALSRRAGSVVRRCADRFGFGRIAIQVRIEASGSRGSVQAVRLSGRFAKSPLESCVSRAMVGHPTLRFRQARQVVQVPVFVR